MKDYKHYLIILISFVTYIQSFAQPLKNNKKGAWKTLPLPENFETRKWVATAWTGSDFLYWGGSRTDVDKEDLPKVKGKGTYNEANGFYYTDGWMINPKTGKVRKMNTAGLPISIEGYTSVWTGKYLFVRAGEYNIMRLFDPKLNKWKAVSLRGAPLDKRINNVLVWTGKEVLIWGGSNYAGNKKMSSGYLYNPETNTWRRTAPSIISERKSPAVLKIGKEIIIWGEFWGKKMDGAAYNTETNTWRKIADCPFKQPKMNFVPYATTFWTGKEGIFLGGNSVAYNPTTDKWRDLKMQYTGVTMISSNFNTWDGQKIFSTGGIWDYKSGQFSKFPRRAYAPSDIMLEVWLNDVLFILAKNEKKAYLFDPKAAYTPPVFTTKFGTYTDPRDKQTYKTVTVGNQTWMVENLRYNAPESNVYDKKPENIKYGKMYSAKTATSACPPGWRLPNEKDMKALLDHMGGKKFAMINLFPVQSAINKFKGTGKSGLNFEMAGGNEHGYDKGWKRHFQMWAPPIRKREYFSKAKTYRYVMAPSYLYMYKDSFFRSTLNSRYSQKQRFYIRCIKK